MHSELNAGLHAIDVVVLAAYLIGTLGLGLWLGRDPKDSTDYFLAGHRIPTWAVLASIVATETSTLTFISIPGLAYTGDFTFLQIAMGYLLGRTIVAYVMLPKYVQGEMVTAYAYLEKRFGPRARKFASGTFMCTRALGDSVRLFATAIPVTLILRPYLAGTPAEKWLAPASLLVLAVFTVPYTYFGGMRADIWTDVLQLVVYLGGAIVALVVINNETHGGWQAIGVENYLAGKFKVFDLSLGLDKPHTLLAGLIGGAFLSMASHGADQLIVQRLLATSNLKKARRALIGSGVLVFIQFSIFLLIGAGLYTFYDGARFKSPDMIFPRFIFEKMPPGMVGLLLAAILAAAMSTIGSSLNSLSATTLYDFYLPLTGRKAAERRTLLMGKRFTLMWGLVLFGGAFLYPATSNSLVSVALSIASFTSGGLLGGFFLGLFVKRAREKDAIVGMALSIASMIAIVFGLSNVIAWPWFVTIGTALTLFFGHLSSKIL